MQWLSGRMGQGRDVSVYQDHSLILFSSMKRLRTIKKIIAERHTVPPVIHEPIRRRYPQVVNDKANKPDDSATPPFTPASRHPSAKSGYQKHYHKTNDNAETKRCDNCRGALGVQRKNKRPFHPGPATAPAANDPLGNRATAESAQHFDLNRRFSGLVSKTVPG